MTRPPRIVTVSRMVSVFFGVGRLRPAPGTWASAAAVALGALLYRLGSFPLLFAATVLAIAAGFWACGRELRDRPGADPGEIVIDEVAGQWLALLFPAFGFWWVVPDAPTMAPAGPITAFVLFRLFDIWKPWIIGRADRRSDPAGVMLDDLWAGVFAGVGTVVLAGIVHLLILR